LVDPHTVLDLNNCQYQAIFSQVMALVDEHLSNKGHQKEIQKTPDLFNSPYKIELFYLGIRYLSLQPDKILSLESAQSSAASELSKLGQEFEKAVKSKKPAASSQQTRQLKG